MLDTYFSRVGCNTYTVWNDNNDAFIIDPGYNKDNCLIEHIKKLGVNVVAILVTHCHYDHIAALNAVLKEFPNATTYINIDEADSYADPKINLTKFIEEDYVDIIDALPKKVVKLFDGEEFELCGYSIKMIATPFHTSGSCCYYIANEEILFSGDTLFYTTIGRTDLPTGSVKTVESSLLKLIALPDAVKVYPGHGPTTRLEREKKYNTHLRNL